LIFCPISDEPGGACQTCRHRAGDHCGLTRAPLPDSGGCCHWNVAPVETWVAVTPAMVAPLAGFFDTVRHILTEVPHQVSETGWVIPAIHRERLTALGIGYQVEHDGLRVDPEQLILTVDEPVTAILDRLDAPYRIEPETGGVTVNPLQLQLPLVFGEGVGE
jgi:hypothetical protein